MFSGAKCGSSRIALFFPGMYRSFKQSPKNTFAPNPGALLQGRGSFLEESMTHNDLCHKYAYGNKWMKSHTGMGHYITFQVWGYKKYDVLSACGQRFEWDISMEPPAKKCKKCAKYEAKLKQ